MHPSQLIASVWISRVDPGSIVVADGRMDAMWARGRTPWLAGPDTRPARVTHDISDDWLIGVQFCPGAAGLALGFDASEVTDLRVPLDGLLPSRLVAGWAESLGSLSDPLDQARLFASMLAQVGDPAPDPDPMVLTTLAGLHRCRPALSSSLSERQRRRRFVRAIGYGPKFASQVIRFHAFVRRANTTTAPLAHLASACGYTDESHLSRETRAFTDATPARVRTGDVRFVQWARRSVT